MRLSVPSTIETLLRVSTVPVTSRSPKTSSYSAPSRNAPVKVFSGEPAWRLAASVTVLESRPPLR